MLAPEFVAEFRRRRITDALTELCIEKSFQDATMADISGRAEVSRSTLYEHFRNRNHVLNVAVEYAFSSLFERVTEACTGAGGDPERRLRLGLAELLAWVADEPEAAWLCLIEAFRGTPQTRSKYFEALSRFSQLLRDSFPDDAARSPLLEDSLAGGVASILTGMLRQGEADRVPAMEEQLMTVIQLPYSSN